MTRSIDDLSLQALHRTRCSVVVVDMVESVRLIAANEEDTVQRWRRFVGEVIAHVLPEKLGRLVKSLGDGLLCEFATALPAVEAALGMLQVARTLNEGHAGDSAIELRIGVHTADVIVDELDVYGSGVNLAARLMTLAGPGEIVVSSEARDELTAGLDAELEDLGECYLKHLAQPVRAYRLSPAERHRAGDFSYFPLASMRPTVAVIPWMPRVDSPEQLGVGDLIADEVIASLSRSSDLFVVSRLSTSAFRYRTAEPSEIRRLLGADYVVGGTCYVQGTELSAGIEVTEVKTGHVLWADRIGDHVGALLKGESVTVERIVQQVAASILRRQVERAGREPYASLESFSLLMAAVSLLHRSAPADFESARAILEHLIDRDRRHPLPHAWLAKWYVLKVTQGWSQDIRRDTTLAHDQTKAALDTDAHCSLALAVDGFVNTMLIKDFSAAQRSLDLALEVNPNEPLAWLFKSTMYSFEGDGERGLDAAGRAVRLSPLDPSRYFFQSLAAAAAMSAGRYQQAVELAQRSLRANRMFASTWRALAIGQVKLGHLEQARETGRSLLKLEPNLTVSGYLARHPAGMFETGKSWAEALRTAGVPD